MIEVLLIIGLVVLSVGIGLAIGFALKANWKKKAEKTDVAGKVKSVVDLGYADAGCNVVLGQSPYGNAALGLFGLAGLLYAAADAKSKNYYMILFFRYNELNVVYINKKDYTILDKPSIYTKEDIKRMGINKSFGNLNLYVKLKSGQSIEFATVNNFYGFMQKEQVAAFYKEAKEFAIDVNKK